MACPAPAVDFSSLLESACDIDRLYEAPAGRVGLASSHDRSLRNEDGAGYIRKEGDRYLVADLKGPGAITRLWTASAWGKIWIHVDGASKPLIETDFRRLFTGETPPFAKSFVNMQRPIGYSYHWSYVPIPFARSCRVYVSQPNYFQADYVTFPDNVEVKTLSLPLSKRHRETLRRLAPRFTSDSLDIPDGESMRATKSIAPGATATLLSLEGPAIIRSLRMRWSDMSPNRSRLATLSICWDGETTPSVRVPLLDFFGSGFKTLALGRDDEGFGYCRLPMPFAERAQISVANHGDDALRVEAELVVDHSTPLPDDVRTFHAQWRRELETRPAEVIGGNRLDDAICDPAQGYLVADLRGRGHYIGTMRHSTGPPEGDEFITVDGADGWRGTGYEDYFDMAWDGQTMGAPFAGGLEVEAVNETFRFHGAAPIAFDQSLRFVFEVGLANSGRQDYDTTAFWYQTEPRAAAVDDWPPPAARRFRSRPMPPQAVYTSWLDGHLTNYGQADWFAEPELPPEAEALEARVIRNGVVVRKNMLEHGPDWSGGAVLELTPTQANSVFEIDLPPTEGGWHDLTLCWATGPNRGRARLGVEGEHTLQTIHCAASEEGARVAMVGSIWRLHGESERLRIETDQPFAIDWLTEEPTHHLVTPFRVLGRFDDQPTTPTEWPVCPQRVLPGIEEMAHVDPEIRRLHLPPSVAWSPAIGRDQTRGYLLEANIRAPRRGSYQLDWRGNVDPPTRIEVNGRGVRFGPHHYARALPNGELPRQTRVLLFPGDNTLRFLLRTKGDAWFTLDARGVDGPPEFRLAAGDARVLSHDGSRAPWVEDGVLWFEGKAGHGFDVALPVDRSGPKRLSARFAHSACGGVARVLVGGKSIGLPYDCRHGLGDGGPSVIVGDEVFLADRLLTKGACVVRVEITTDVGESARVGVVEITLRNADATQR